jgi:chloride channel protein, CIC family
MNLGRKIKETRKEQRRIDFSEKFALWGSMIAQGIGAGAIALLFLYLIRLLYRNTYLVFAERSLTYFMVSSLLLISITSLISGLLLHYVSPSAAGSGIPEIKISYWKTRGLLRPRNVIVKLVAGVLSIGGGQSLGREGPSIYLGGGLASNLSGLFGTSPRDRRMSLLSGSAAGLAAAFNTPLAGVAFVLEEITGEISDKILGVAAFTSLVATFMVHMIIGSHPAFAHLQLESVRWAPYIGIPFVALITAGLGVFFHRSIIRIRRRFTKQNTLPGWLRPFCGGLVTWVLGCAVFARTGQLGVFSMGTFDLDQMLSNKIDWRVAGILAAAKILATIACYAFGGCGGVFAPALFFGGMTGYFSAGLLNLFIPLTASDYVVLGLVGMTSCLGAIIRAPLTSFLIIFEMTHHFSLIPALFLGTLVSQFISRLFGPYSFYEELLVQDGYEHRFIKPTIALKSWYNLPVSEIINKDPVIVQKMSKKEVADLLKKFSHHDFPVVINGKFFGLVNRENMKNFLDQGDSLKPEKAVTCSSNQTVKDISRIFVKSSQTMIPVIENKTGKLAGIITLNDLLRAEAVRAR